MNPGLAIGFFVTLGLLYTAEKAAMAQPLESHEAMSLPFDKAGAIQKKFEDKSGASDTLKFLMAHNYQRERVDPTMAHLMSLLTSKPPSLPSSFESEDYFEEPPVELVFGRRLALKRPNEPISLMGSSRHLSSNMGVEPISLEEDKMKRLRRTHWGRFY